MKYLKFIYIILFTFVLSGCGKTQPANEDTFNIVTSFYPIYVMTENITEGAQNLTVKNLTKPTEGCLHDYSLTTGDLKTLDNADCLIINGLGMESFIDNALRQYPDIVITDSSKTYENSPYTISATEEEHDGHDHEVNPHIWLDTDNAIAQVDNITQALISLDPKNQEVYQKNSQNYIEEINKLKLMIPQITKETPTVSFHEGFDYLLSPMGYHVEMCISLEENTQPSPKELGLVADFIEDNNIKTIFAANDNTLQIAKTIAEETGAKLILLDPITTGDGDKNDYINKMADNIKAVVEVSNE